jgi:hypothetical protein
LYSVIEYDILIIYDIVVHDYSNKINLGENKSLFLQELKLSKKKNCSKYF